LYEINTNYRKYKGVGESFFMYIFVTMKPIVKNALVGVASFVAYRFYKLYELGASVIYKPLDWKFGKVDWSRLDAGGVPLNVTIEILNPTNASVRMRGIDGVLKFNGKVISNFSSKPFDINAGRSSFTMVFRLNGLTTINQLLSYVRDKKNDKVEVDMKIKIPFFTLSNKFQLSITKALVDSAF
jgi:hypothetical protein